MRFLPLFIALGITIGAVGVAHAQADDYTPPAPVERTISVVKYRPTGLLLDAKDKVAQIWIVGIGSNDRVVAGTVTEVVLKGQSAKLQGYAVDSGSKPANCQVKFTDVVGRDQGKVFVDFKKLMETCF